MFIKTSLKILSSLGLAGLIYFVGFQQGCSPVLFDSLEPLSCDEFPAQSNCEKTRISIPKGDPVEMPDLESPRPRVRAPEELYDVITYNISLGEVAFLFVIDISSSMAVEHRNLANQLNPFLKSIKNLKYHVALITMDISGSPGNPVRGAYYQDGKFIPIGGRPYLSNKNLGSHPEPSVIADFQKALEREETRRCDTRNQPSQSGDKWDRYYEKQQSVVSCPSSDERGTYAMNLAVQNSDYRGFFDRNHVMFIPVTDEDVRSGEEFYNQPDMEEYQPEELDLPESLVSNILKTFPRLRTFSFHPIIIPPGDNSCLKKQNRNADGGPGSGRGYYGRLYAKLVRPDKHFSISGNFGGNFLRGNIISICDRYYRSQLSQISLLAQESKIPLPCNDPERVKLYVNNREIDPDYRIEGRALYVSSKRALTVSDRVQVEVYCPVKGLIDDLNSEGQF